MRQMLMTIPGLVALVGALAYGLGGAKLQELGRLAFLAGVLALLLNLR